MEEAKASLSQLFLSLKDDEERRIFHDWIKREFQPTNQFVDDRRRGRQQQEEKQQQQELQEKQQQQQLQEKQQELQEKQQQQELLGLKDQNLVIIDDESESSSSSSLSASERAAAAAAASVRLSNGEALMRAAAEEIRAQVPLEAVLETENIVAQPGGEKESSTSVHVDFFLYDDDDIDDLVDQGKFSRHYCRQCLSRDVKALDFISHSASISQVKYVIGALLPVALEECSLSLSSLNFLDVGSRFGPFLLGANLFSAATSDLSFNDVVGVEINEDLCRLQRRIASKYLSPEVHVVPRILCSDIVQVPDVVGRSDVVILHNVFQYFSSIEEQRSLWRFLLTTIRVESTLVITCPSLEESLAALGDEFKVETLAKKVGESQIGGNFKKKLARRVKELGLDFDRDELEDFHVYQLR